MHMSRDFGVANLGRQSVKGRIVAKIRHAARWKRLVAQELQVPAPISPARKLALLRKGFLSQSGVIYGRLAQEPSLYLSDLERMMTSEIDGDFVPLLRNKVLFYHLMLWNGLRHLVPELYGILQTRGRLLDIDGVTESGLDEAVAAHLDAGRPLVLKPLGGGGGVGIVALRRDEQGTQWNGEPLGEEELRSRLAHVPAGYSLWELVVQAEYARQVFPGSANTIRMLTMWDYEAREPFIATAVHRFGTQKSKSVDNWKAGGVCGPVDLISGVVGTAVANPGRGRQLTWHSTHPDTGAQIEGLAIPGWHAACDTILGLARKLWFLPYVGWDVVMCDDGIKILEGNHFSDVNLLQVHGPLLADPRVRRFYAAHRVVRAKAP